jgi:hypothetical protein
MTDTDPREDATYFLIGVKLAAPYVLTTRSQGVVYGKIDVLKSMLRDNRPTEEVVTEAKEMRVEELWPSGFKDWGWWDEKLEGFIDRITGAYAEELAS